MIDTCQANTMFSKIDSSNILAMGSLPLGESLYFVREPSSLPSLHGL